MIETEWIKASASSGAGQCVEQKRNADGTISLRDSKNPTGPTLTFTPAEYSAWLDGAKKGEFSHLV